MKDVAEDYPHHFTKCISINASASAIWQAITQPEQMQQWMAETPIDITTSWQVGSPITISGPWYKTRFENRGTVLCYEPFFKLSYTHLSSLSQLSELPENQTIYEFVLTGADNETTELSFTARRFATSAIYHHLAFYWNVTLHKIKRQVEAATQY